MKRLLYTLLFIMAGVTIGKWCQYSAVAYLGGKLGFECASLIGLTPFIAALLVLKSKYPRFFGINPK